MKRSNRYTYTLAADGAYTKSLPVVLKAQPTGKGRYFSLPATQNAICCKIKEEPVKWKAQMNTDKGKI